jgi:hypothetical protein
LFALFIIAGSFKIELSFLYVTEEAKLCSKLQVKRNNEGNQELVRSLYETPLGEENLHAIGEKRLDLLLSDE